MFELATSATTATLTVTGDLDVAERSRLPGITAQVTGLRRQLLIIDMCDVTFMDSTGAAFLMSLARALDQQSGATVLRGCRDRVLFVLEVCDALDFFRIDTEHRCPGTGPPPDDTPQTGDTPEANSRGKPLG